MKVKFHDCDGGGGNGDGDGDGDSGDDSGGGGFDSGTLIYWTTKMLYTSMLLRGAYLCMLMNKSLPLPEPPSTGTVQLWLGHG